MLTEPPIIADADTIDCSPCCSASLSSQQQYYLQPAPAGGIPYCLYIPDRLSGKLPPLLLIHGISRNIHQHIDAFSELAGQTGRMLIAPLFDETNCKRYQRVWTQQCQADQLLLAVLRDVRRKTNYAFQKIDLFGFSGGAQFGHRFAMRYPHLIARMAIAAAGWYTFPDTLTCFPYGISARTRNGKMLRNDLKSFLSVPMLVMVGESDIKRDANLRKGRTIDRQQGRSRVERAARWVRAIQREANSWGIPSDISLIILPDSAHDFNRCVQHGGMADCVSDWLISKSVG